MLLLRKAKNKKNVVPYLIYVFPHPLISLKILHPLSLKPPQKFKCTVKLYDKSKATFKVGKICTLMNNSY